MKYFLKEFMEVKLLKATTDRINAVGHFCFKTNQTNTWNYKHLYFDCEKSPAANNKTIRPLDIF
jgi:hypothetical protein